MVSLFIFMGVAGIYDHTQPVEPYPGVHQEAPQTPDAPGLPLGAHAELVLSRLLEGAPLTGVVLDVAYDPSLADRRNLGESQYDGRASVVIRLLPGMSYSLEAAVLIHEWAHMLAALSEPWCSDCSSHGVCWGVQYSRSYRAVYGD